jgi:Heme exporter protein D (CcmD)
MMEALATLMASKHWVYVWPCYALAIATFGGLAVRAVLKLAHWKKRATAEPDA